MKNFKKLYNFKILYSYSNQDYNVDRVIDTCIKEVE